MARRILDLSPDQCKEPPLRMAFPAVLPFRAEYAQVAQRQASHIAILEFRDTSHFPAVFYV